LHVSGAALLAPHLTPENMTDVCARAEHRSKRDIERLVAELAPKPDAPSLMRKLPKRRATSAKPAQVPGKRLSPAIVPPPARPAPPLTPTSPARYKVQFTASQALHDKLARLRALTRTQVPDGDLAAVVELAVDAYLAKVDATRFGKTKTPRTTVETTDTTPRTRHVPAAVRRAVTDRDGNQCTFVGVDGHRCAATDDLQFDHLRAYAKGGEHSVENLTLRCRAHNAYRATLEFGERRTSRARETGPSWATRAGQNTKSMSYGLAGGRRRQGRGGSRCEPACSSAPPARIEPTRDRERPRVAQPPPVARPNPDRTPIFANARGRAAAHDARRPRAAACATAPALTAGPPNAQTFAAPSPLPPRCPHGTALALRPTHAGAPTPAVALATAAHARGHAGARTSTK
jgi:5-methylcytosine-specific restriction endonuclease McrA